MESVPTSARIQLSSRGLFIGFIPIAAQKEVYLPPGLVVRNRTRLITTLIYSPPGDLNQHTRDDCI